MVSGVKHTIGVAEAAGMIRSRRELRRRGWSERGIRAALQAGTLVRVRRGWYARSSDWEKLWPEGRHLLSVLACGQEMTGGTHVFSHVSAGAVHGLPAYRMPSSRVHVTGRTSMQAASGASVFRHEDRLAAEDVTVVDGVVCTSLERTAFDLMRLSTPEAAVATADAALRRHAYDRFSIDEVATEEWRESMRARARNAGAVRGIRQARWVIEFADGGAQSVGESVSRLQLDRLGFGAMRTQVAVPAPTGGFYWVDLGLDAVSALGEFDGKDKYLDEALRLGLSIEEVVLREKQREDWIRGTTQLPLARWGDEHLVSTDTLGRRLASFNIRPPR